MGYRGIMGNRNFGVYGNVYQRGGLRVISRLETKVTVKGCLVCCTLLIVDAFSCFPVNRSKVRIQFSVRKLYKPLKF